MNITFRRLTEAELDVADNLLVTAYQFSGSRRAVVARYLALQPDGWWLALVDGVPVGYGGAVIYGSFCYIGMLSVLPALQRQGIGRALTRHIMQWSEQQGYKTMLLECRSPSVSFCQSLGFVEDDTTIQMVQKMSADQPYARHEAVTVLDERLLTAVWMKALPSLVKPYTCHLHVLLTGHLMNHHYTLSFSFEPLPI